MLRLAIASVVVALFATADVNGQCGCVDQASKNVKVSGQSEVKVSAKIPGDWVCFVRVVSYEQFYTHYVAKNCTTGAEFNVFGPPDQALGDCSNPTAGGCTYTTDPEAKYIFHHKMNPETRKKINALFAKKLSDQIELAIDFVRLETGKMGL